MDFGKTAEIVFFPRDDHNLTRTSEPKHLVECLNWQVRWLEKQLDSKREAGLPADRRGR